MSEFEQSLDSGFPQSWRPDEGGEDNPNPLIGTFLEMSSATTAYGPAWVMHVKLEDGSERSVWLIHTVLRNELARARPKPGERLGIKYLGKITPEGGQSYVGYKVKVDRPHGEAFDWTKLGAEPDGVDVLSDPPAPTQEPVTVPAGVAEDDIPF